MKDIIQELIYMIRANPKQARIAIILDSTIGLTVALVVYIIMSTTGMTFTIGAILALSSAFFLVAITVVGYYLITNSTMVYGDSAQGAFAVDDDSATEYDVDMDKEREQQ